MRYSVERRSGQWAYLCRDRGSCRQRQLARQTQTTDPEDPLRSVDAVPDTFTVSLNTSGEEVMRGMSIAESIAHYQLARARSPRSWKDIGSGDQHSLTALVTAVAALYEAASDARRHVVVAARKAGVSWQDLAYATGGDDAASFREWYLREMDQSYDWPEEHEAEIRRLLDGDTSR